MEEFGEEPGYMNRPGFVKGNPLNNDSYIEKCLEDFSDWPEAVEEIKETYARLLRSGRPFNVSQIKEKFGELRFYYDFLD